MPNRLVPPIPRPASQRRGSPAVQLLPSGCGANKGPVGRRGPSQPRSLRARRAGCREESLFRTFLIASSQRGLGGSQLSGRGRVPSPTQTHRLPCSRGVGLGPPDTLAKQVWLWSPVTRLLCVHLSPSPCLSPRGHVIIVLPCVPH